MLFLSWSLETIMAFVSAIPIMIASIFYLYSYLEKKYQSYLYLGLCCLFGTLICFIIGFSDLYLSENLFLMGAFSFIPMGFCLILLLDSMTRESIDPIKLTIMSMIAIAVIATSFDPNVIQAKPILEQGYWVVFFTFPSLFGIFGILMLLYFGTLIIYYFIKIDLSVPNNLKPYSTVLIIGGLSF
ncbi:MAG: hypothetical protein ACTSRG_11515 [Candidatus Helarchaeota archaeon]